MTRTLLTITLVATAALAGCNKEENAQVAENTQAENMAAPVELPPAITASKTYRCKDNSVVYIDWLSDGNARVKKSRDEYTAPTITPGAEDSPLTGAAADASVTYNGQSCKA